MRSTASRTLSRLLSSYSVMTCPSSGEGSTGLPTRVPRREISTPNRCLLPSLLQRQGEAFGPIVSAGSGADGYGRTQDL